MAQNAKAQWKKISSKIEEKKNTLFCRLLRKWRRLSRAEYNGLTEKTDY